MLRSVQIGIARVLMLVMAGLTTGCNSVPQNVALGAVIGTGVGAIIPGHDIE